MSDALRILGALALAAPLAAGAGDLEIAPVLVELSPEARTALVSVRNAGRQPARYQARAYEWGQASDGATVLTPAKDLVLFPPLLELLPGETRNLRLGTDAAPGPSERSWRLFVEELPRRETSTGAPQVQVLTRIGVPVFLAPAQRTAKAEIAFLPAEGARVRFTLRNVGSVRIRPSAVTLTLLSADDQPLLERSLEAWYVLAGGERVYEIEVPAGACARAAKAVAAAALDDGAVVGRAAARCRAP